MIGVCIKYFHENYGGMLQALATVSLLDDMGLEYELIQYEKRHTPIGVLRSLPRLFNSILMNDKYEVIKKKLGKLEHPEFAHNDAIRMQEFEKFRKVHFTKLSPVFKGMSELRMGANRYSAILTGSDQLWSPAGLPTNYYNLMFVPDDIRKISYASSFGVNRIPWYQTERTARYLNRIEFVSMRENRGAELVKELTGREVPVVIDPVLMLDQAEWEKLVPVEGEVQEPYIFAYFLGSNAEHRTLVKEISQKLNCKIVALRHIDQYVPADESFGDIAPYDVGPAHFLNLLRGAEYVCTDSFHGVCFSVIHRKRFVVFNRYQDDCEFSKNSRIDTICENLELQDRRYTNRECLLEQLTADIDFSKVAQNLGILQKEAYAYLDTAFRGIHRRS